MSTLFMLNSNSIEVTNLTYEGIHYPSPQNNCHSHGNKALLLQLSIESGALSPWVPIALSFIALFLECYCVPGIITIETNIN